MNQTIGYKLVKNYTQTAEKAPYVGMAIPVGSLAYDDILVKMLDSGTFMTQSTAEYFLKAFYEYAADEIGENVMRVSTGTVALYPAISGSFPSEDAAFDATKNALYVGASLAQTVRDEVAALTPSYDGDEASASKVKLSSVMDVATKALGVIVGTNDFRLAGVELAVPDAADESLTLVKKDGVTKVCDIAVSGNDGGLYLTCHLPATAAIAKGTYKIRLASHGLDPTAPLAVRTLNVCLAEAVLPVPSVTLVKCGDLADNVVKFENGAVYVTLANYTPQDGDKLYLEAVKDGAVFENFEVTSQKTASAENLITFASGIENTSEKSNAEWVQYGKRFYLKRGTAEYEKIVTFVV